MTILRATLAALLLFLSAVVVEESAAQGLIGAIAASDTESGTDSAAPPASTGDEQLDALLEQARQSGTPVIVLPPPVPKAAQDGAEGADGEADGIDDAVIVRNSISSTLKSAPNAAAAIGDALSHAGRNDGVGLGWMLPALAVLVIAVAVAFGARFFVSRWANSYLKTVNIDPARDRVALTGLVILRLFISWVALAAFFIAGIAFIIIVSPGESAVRTIPEIAIINLTLFYFVRGLFALVLSPEDETVRLVSLDTQTAAKMLRQLTIIAVIGTFTLFLTTSLDAIGVEATVADLARTISSFIILSMFAGFAIIHRKEVAALIKGSKPKPSLWKNALAAVWHLLFVGYLAVAFAINVVTIVTTEGFNTGPILGPIFATLAGYVTFGLAIIIIDRQVRARQAALYAATGGTARGVSPDQATDAAVSSEGADPDSIEPVALWQLRWKAFADKVAGMVGIVVAILVLAAVWGQLNIESTAFEWVGIAVILFITYVIYLALKTWIDGKIEDEEGPSAVDSEDGMGPGASRLATLLPLLRNVLFITVLTIVGTVVLAGMGVNVAPLFAGAGIIGLAIGFGAQSLIRDIFSGAFFLADDAFRRGEYIDVGGTTGAVEKISLRSFQLRHHNGPLHTIPFGSISQLTNYSRDWVIMKLKLRLVYGTDIEKVRKLVKKLGQQIAADPEVGPLFLEPLKSQGVVEMEDSAMICRVKFMTKPGDQ
ncbi:MAG: mechanosensitive ion channel domain-containing protein, partial [Pseudomonadota bacterium]